MKQTETWWTKDGMDSLRREGRENARRRKRGIS
jgi:hypothetical protein